MNDIDAKKKGKQFIGKVVSVRTDKTAYVEVMHVKRHPLYKKSMKRTKRFAVHNENSDIKAGDTVVISETRPISKTKHFVITKKV